MRVICWFCCGIFGTACKVDTSVGLQILAVPTRDSSCLYSSDSASNWLRGYFDPTGQSHFELSLTLRNNLQTEEEDPLELFEDTNIRPRANDIKLLGFDSCWYREQPITGKTTTATEIASSQGKVIDCKNSVSFKVSDFAEPQQLIPDEQRRYLSSNGIIERGGGKNVALIDILTQADLVGASMFGAAFNPGNIPVEGILCDTNGSGALDAADDFFVIGFEHPSDSPRNAAWGDYPTTRTTTVIVQVQAFGETQNGTQVKSDWFVYPIDLCVGCVFPRCGALSCKVCTGTTPLVSNARGKRPNFIDACLPFQGDDFTCDDFDGCTP